MKKFNLLKNLDKRIKKCRKCPLWRTRIQVVPGEGNPQAKILIIGETPGQEEDKQGRPFCGRAGRFLDELLGLVGLKREKVFITNVVKCRPFVLSHTEGPKNRTPKKEEITKCRFWLGEQIKILKPKLIITLGSSALNWFFPELKISQIHGRILKILKNKLITFNFKLSIFPTFHPAAAFRRGNLRQILKKDFRKIFKMKVF